MPCALLGLAPASRADRIERRALPFSGIGDYEENMATEAGQTDYTWDGKRGEKWASKLAETEAMLAPIDAPLLDAARLDGPFRVADIGSGGGATTRAIADRAPKGSVVHGYDISPALVDIAKQRSAARGALAPLEFFVADAQSTPAPSTPYDRLVSRFGVMFFADPAAAFSNLATWLGRGGRLAFAVWGPHADNQWFMKSRDAVNEVVAVPKPEPDTPGPFRYADVKPLVALLERAGLGDIRVDDWHGSLAIGGGLPAPAAAALAIDSFGGFSELLAEAGGDARERATKGLEARLAGHVRDGIVSLPCAAHIVTAVRA